MWYISLNDTTAPEIYTLSLHDALPISSIDTIAENSKVGAPKWNGVLIPTQSASPTPSKSVNPKGMADRKSTRLNSSHMSISYAVFCLKKKNRRTRSSRHVLEQAPTEPI